MAGSGWHLFLCFLEVLLEDSHGLVFRCECCIPGLDLLPQRLELLLLLGLSLLQLLHTHAHTHARTRLHTRIKVSRASKAKIEHSLPTLCALGNPQTSAPHLSTIAP
jgi:hypothetical protein